MVYTFYVVCEYTHGDKHHTILSIPYHKHHEFFSLSRSQVRPQLCNAATLSSSAMDFSRALIYSFSLPCSFHTGNIHILDINKPRNPYHHPETPNTFRGHLSLTDADFLFLYYLMLLYSLIVWACKVLLSPTTYTDCSGKNEPFLLDLHRKCITRTPKWKLKE